MSGVSILGLDGVQAEIRGSVTGANDSALENLDLVSLGAAEILLAIENSAMRVHQVRFIGMPESRDATGILAMGAEAAGTVISECDFTDLAIGIDIVDGLPLIRRCVFTDPSLAGIRLQATALVD